MTKKERENKRERANTLSDTREKESEKLKKVTIQRRFCENCLCFEVFKDDFMKTVMEMFVIQTKTVF